MKIKNYISGFVVFLFASIGLISCSQNTAAEVKTVTDNKFDFPTESIIDFFAEYTDSGFVQLSVKAPLMNRYSINVPQIYEDMPKGLDIKFYDKLGNVKTTLTANQGKRFEASQLVEVHYNVELINSEGEKLKTEHLIWKQDSGIVRTTSYVQIVTNGKILHGDGLIAKDDFTEYEILRPRGELKVNDADSLK